MSGEEDAWWTRAVPATSVPAQPTQPERRTPATAGVATTTYRTRPPRRRAPFGDQRGLTALGATIVVLVLSSIGAAFDVNTGTGLRGVFTLAFCISAGLAASTVHREDLLASVLLLPFVYTVICIFAAPMDQQGSSKIAIGDLMLQSAPSLIYAVLSASVVAGTRWFLGRRRRAQRRIVSYR